MNEYRTGINEATGEIRPTMWFVVKVCIALIFVGVIIGGVGYVLGWFSEAGKVAQQQFGAQALLTKYEWFKDASAQLDKKQADITVYESRMTAMANTYNDTPRVKWPREDREQYNVWSSEVAGVRASYNQLAADYNAQMTKFNYAFTNVGELPRGAEKPLPRDYKPYAVQ